MKRNELKKLHNYYVTHTAVVEKMESVDEIHDYLLDKQMHLGICNCSKLIFEVHCYTYFKMIGIRFPFFLDTKTEIISVLKERIELLHSELLKNMQKFVDQLPSGLCKVEFDYLEYRGDNLDIDICDNEIRFKGDIKYLKLWLEN